MYVCIIFQRYHLCASNLFNPVSGLCLVNFINNEMIFKIMQFFINITKKEKRMESVAIKLQFTSEKQLLQR